MTGRADSNAVDRQPLLGPPNLGRTSPTSASEVSAFSFTSQCGEGSMSMPHAPVLGPQGQQPGVQGPQMTPKPNLYRYPSWASIPVPGYTPPSLPPPAAIPPMQGYPAPRPTYPWMGYYPAQSMERAPRKNGYPAYVKVLNWFSAGVVFLNLLMDIFFSKYAWSAATLLLAGPLAVFFALLAVFVNHCGCYSNVDKTARDIRVLSTTGVVFDLVGAISIPLIFYSIICPEDQLDSCEHDLPAGQGLSVAQSLAMVLHGCALLVLRKNADAYAQQSFHGEGSGAGGAGGVGGAQQPNGNYGMHDLQIRPSQGSFYGRPMSMSGLPTAPMPLYK